MLHLIVILQEQQPNIVKVIVKQGVAYRMRGAIFPNPYFKTQGGCDKETCLSVSQSAQVSTEMCAVYLPAQGQTFKKLV